MVTGVPLRKTKPFFKKKFISLCEKNIWLLSRFIWSRLSNPNPLDLTFLFKFLKKVSCFFFLAPGFKKKVKSEEEFNLIFFEKFSLIRKNFNFCFVSFFFFLLFINPPIGIFFFPFVLTELLFIFSILLFKYFLLYIISLKNKFDFL